MLLEKLHPQRKLAEQVVARIGGEIRAGRLAPGARLPTELELMNAMGVSRTVIREAVAALRAEGLVDTRQGSGAFVASDESRVPFRIDPKGLQSIAEVLEVMELRMAVEVEGAALAAARASARQGAAILKALAEIAAAIARGDPAVTEDFAFHRAIAEATGNPRFPQFLAYLGRFVIPRHSIRTTVARPKENVAYLQRIQAEHARIADAIAARDEGEARRAMRAHLSNSLQRYRKLAGRGAADTHT